MSKDDVHEIDVDKDGKDGDWSVVESASLIPKEDETEISRRSRSTYVFIFIHLRIHTPYQSTCSNLHITIFIYLIQSQTTGRRVDIKISITRIVRDGVRTVDWNRWESKTSRKE